MGQGNGECLLYYPTPQGLKRRGNVSQNWFCSLWCSERGRGSRKWFILRHCEKQKLTLQLGMPHAQDDPLNSCGKDGRSAGRTFSSQEFMYHVHADMPDASIQQQFWFSFMFPIVSYSQEDPHTVSEFCICKIYEFSNYFNSRSMSIPVLMALWQFKELKTRLSVSHLHWRRPVHWYSFFMTS